MSTNFLYVQLCVVLVINTTNVAKAKTRSGLIMLSTYNYKNGGYGIFCKVS